MALESGTQLGHYEVTDLLGKGGMGEVYRARDTKLGREVAIKVLPSEFSQDEERLARLEREARMLAALNHPSIAAIYGLEQSEDTRFLVLELVEGDTLADRLTRGAIPVEESLKLALQIAEALEAAHEKGVIHRDLKPANIKVTPEGKVKVLDFGLAKAFIGEQADVNLSNSPTLSMQATQQGVILGTAAYMSPEQARGETADQRTDVWAFGVVLFEMLTGRGTFDGRTVSDVLAGVLAKEPPWDNLPHNLHSRLRLLLERCVAKELKDRYSGVGDARVDIESVLADPAGVIVQPTAEVFQAASQSKLPWVAVVLALLLGATAWILKPGPAQTPGAVTRFHEELLNPPFFRNTGRNVVAISPNGQQVAYNLVGGLYLRNMGEDAIRFIPGTEGALTNPTFSPDGEWIAFYDVASSQLRRIPVTGGTSAPIAGPTGNPRAIRWNPDDTILYSDPGGVSLVPADGGDPEVLVEAGQGEALSSAQLLPNGSLLFVTSTGGTAQVAVQIPGAEERTVLFSAEQVEYVPTGHLIVTDPAAAPNTLFARSFDPDTLELGGAVPMAENVLLTSMTHFAVSETGTLLYPEGVGALALVERGMALVGRDGSTTRLNIPSDAYVHPRLSPDGDRLVVQTAEEGEPSRIWIYDLSEDTARIPLTLPQEGNNIRPIWSPDGESVTFASDRNGTFSLYIQPADRSEPARQITSAAEDTQHWPDDWSPNGTLAYTVAGGGTGADMALWFVNPDAGTEPEIFYDIPGSQEVGAVFSPDGDWIAYSSGESGGAIVQVQNVQTRAQYEISSGTAAYPLWPMDDELFYRPIGGGAGLGSTTMIGRDIFTEPAIRYGDEYDVPIGNFSTVLYNRSFDSLDGETFLVVTLPSSPVDDPGSTGQIVHFVLNWFEELKERVPVD